MNKNFFLIRIFCAIACIASLVMPSRVYAVNAKAGFYNIGTADGVTITAAASSGEVTEVNEDVDGDSVADVLYNGSDKLTVVYSKAMSEKYYIVWLIEGTTLPSSGADSKVYYVNQQTATGTSVEFNVFPKEIKETMQMTLFIASDDGNPMVNIPLSYLAYSTFEHKLTKSEAVAAGCETIGNSEYWTCSECGKYFSDAEGANEIAENSWMIPATGHAWADIAYNWAEDNSTVTALKACNNNHAHDISETVAVMLATLREAQCESAGEGFFVAEFENEEFTTQTKKIVIPASDHSYKLTGWTWADDYTKAIALFTCEHDLSHTAEVEASLEGGTIVTDDTVAQKYKDVDKIYTATVAGPDGESYADTITVTLKATHKVHEKKTAKDGAAVNLDVKTDTLEVTIAGEAVSGAAPVLVASYDEAGRFLRLEVVTEQTEKPLESVDGVDSVKIFWVNAKDDTPRCEDEAIKRSAE